MERLAAPLVVVVSALLYFTHDAGFRFEQAPEDKRIEFVERQASRTATVSKLAMLGGPGAVRVAHDQMNVRVKLDADASAFQQRRQELVEATCKAYMSSYLDEHDISLNFEFYHKSGAMAGTVTLAPRTCAVYADRD